MSLLHSYITPISYITTLKDFLFCSRSAMSTDIGGRPVLRPAGNVARANHRKVTKPPLSPVKPKALLPSSKISPPGSQPSTPKTSVSSAARNPPLKPISPIKLPPSLSPKKPPTPSPVSLNHTHQELLSEAPLCLANDGSNSLVCAEVPSSQVFDVSSDGSHLPVGVPLPSADGVSEPITHLMGSDSALDGSEASQNGSFLVSSGGSISAFKKSNPSLARSKSLSKPSPQNGSKPSPHAPVSRTRKTVNPHISLNKSTSDVFHKGATSHVKAKPPSKKNLSKLGSLSFDESSLATMVAAKKAAASEINAQRKQKVSEYGRKQGKASRVAPDVSTPLLSPSSFELKRCKFITAQSDPLFVEYHDKEWGVPVHDDRMLFELLVLAGFQGELSWTTILHKRGAYRAVFAEFNPAAVAFFDEKLIQSLEADRSLGLPGCKIRGVVDNALRILEVMREFGSLDEYLWGFVNKQPMMNNYRYPKQVPVKTSKAEFISKDLVKRGFRFVGPTIIYSFMQASGMTNDHLMQCFRHQECMKLPFPSSVDLIEEKLEESMHHEDGGIHLLNLDFELKEDVKHDVCFVDREQGCEPDEWSHKVEDCTNIRESEEQESNDTNAM
eukprot:c19436_g1_i1 orf=375-2210(-)